MAIQVGRYRRIWMEKQSDPNSWVVPTHAVRHIPPFAALPEIPPLESAAMGGQAEFPVKVVPGPITVSGKKLSIEVEPSDELGLLLMALFGADTVTDNGNGTFTHTFTRLQSAALPTYALAVDAGNEYVGFMGSMLDKADLHFNAKEIKRLDTEWKALNYHTATGLGSWSPSALRPLAWSQVAVAVDGTPMTGFDKALLPGSSEPGR